MAENVNFPRLSDSQRTWMQGKELEIRQCYPASDFGDDARRESLIQDLNGLWEIAKHSRGVARWCYAILEGYAAQWRRMANE